MGRGALAQHNPLSVGMLPIPLQPPLMHYIAEEPNSVFAEAVRAVRLSVQRAARTRPMQSVMVTSAIDGEGKTTLAANLALSYAMLGAQTLLVEGDLRNPEMTRSLCPRAQVRHSRRRARAAFRYGRRSWRIRRSRCRSCRRRSSDHMPVSSEFVFSEAIGVILNELRHHYDMIIIDAPPLIPLVDSAALGEYADGIVMTVGWDRTLEDVVTRALGQLCIVAGPAARHGADPRRPQAHEPATTVYYSSAYIESVHLHRQRCQTGGLITA